MNSEALVPCLFVCLFIHVLIYDLLLVIVPPLSKAIREKTIRAMLQDTTKIDRLIDR